MTTEERRSMVWDFKQRMLNRFNDSPPPPEDDTSLLAFMLANRVEFLSRDDGVSARTFSLEGWVPYGGGPDKRAALLALFANAANTELREEGLGLRINQI